jgi:hypothetical protein
MKWLRLVWDQMPWKAMQRLRADRDWLCRERNRLIDEVAQLKRDKQRDERRLRELNEENASIRQTARNWMEKVVDVRFDRVSSDAYVVQVAFSPRFIGLGFNAERRFVAEEVAHMVRVEIETCRFVATAAQRYAEIERLKSQQNRSGRA